eukprot:2273139-Amphidinium_carterae.1
MLRVASLLVKRRLSSCQHLHVSQIASGKRLSQDRAQPPTGGFAPGPDISIKTFMLAILQFASYSLAPSATSVAGVSDMPAASEQLPMSLGLFAFARGPEHTGMTTAKSY